MRYAKYIPLIIIIIITAGIISLKIEKKPKKQNKKNPKRLRSFKQITFLILFFSLSFWTIPNIENYDKKADNTELSLFFSRSIILFFHVFCVLFKRDLLFHTQHNGILWYFLEKYIYMCVWKFLVKNFIDVFLFSNTRRCTHNSHKVKYTHFDRCFK